MQGGENVEKQDAKKEFIEMTIEIMQEAKECFDVNKGSSEVLREIRENVQMILTMD